MLHKWPMKRILFWVLWLWGIKQYCNIKENMSVYEKDSWHHIFVILTTIWALCKVWGCRKPLLVLGVLCERSLWSQPNCIDSFSLNNSHYSVCQLPQKMGTEWVQPNSTLSANHPLRVKTDTEPHQQLRIPSPLPKWGLFCGNKGCFKGMLIR